MENIIMPKEISITAEIGQAFKTFRIENKIVAKDLIKEFHKASTYLTKLEKGDIKRVDSKLFIDMCDFITKETNTNGVKKFVSRASDNYNDYTPQTQNILMNIDDLLCMHSVKPEFVEHINTCLYEHNLLALDLVEKINNNQDISNFEGYNNFPENEWILRDNDIDKAVIKLNISYDYINNLLSYNIKQLNRVIAEGILYYLYIMIDIGDKAALKVNDSLKQFNIIKYRNSKLISINNDDFHELDKFFGGLEPQVSSSLQKITTQLRVITTVTKEYGSKKISIIEKNLDDDLGFYFAFISYDLSDVIKKSKQTKKEFLADLKKLISKYSEPEKESLDLYLDE
jgi:hypothetical protein